MHIFLPDGSQVQVPAARPYRYCVVARPVDGLLGTEPYQVHGWTTQGRLAHLKANKLREELDERGSPRWWCVTVVEITQRA